MTTSALKKNSAPWRAWERKSEARMAIHLNIEKPAPDFNTNMAIACWVNKPTMTVGLYNSEYVYHWNKTVSVPWNV